jgi:hypothetical protein
MMKNNNNNKETFFEYLERVEKEDYMARIWAEARKADCEVYKPSNKEAKELKNIWSTK